MGESKEKIRNRVRQHMQRALLVGAAGSLVLGAGCQSDPPVVQNPPPSSPPLSFCDSAPISQTILFHFGKVGLDAESKEKIDKFLVQTKGWRPPAVLIVGHADRIGSDALNQRISEKRAAVVKEYLVSKGFEAGRIYIEGKGSNYPETKPGQCKGPKSKKIIICLQPDRRVEIDMGRPPCK